MQCRNHCLANWAYVFFHQKFAIASFELTKDTIFFRGLLPFPPITPFIVVHCQNKAKRECGTKNEDSDDEGNKNAVFDFASMAEANGSHGITGVDMEKLKEALDMEMVD